MEQKAFALRKYALHAEKLAVLIQARAVSLGFAKNDVRTGYLYGVSNAVGMYALSLTLLHAVAHLHRSSFTIVGEGGRPERIENELLPRLVNMLFHNREEAGQTLWAAYTTSQKAHLFFDAWANFEDKIRLFYDAVVPETAKQEDTQDDEHLDIVKIWSRLSSMTKAAGTSTKEERRKHFEVVGFFASARNTVHSNSYYRGKPKTLILNGDTIHLTPGEPTNFMTAIRVLEIVGALVDAFEFACTKVKHDALIVTLSTLRDEIVDWPGTR